MKLKAIVSALSLRKRLTQVIVMAALLVTPLIGLCQPPPPDGNPEVPFDNNMNLLFLAVGIVFAVVITVRQLRKRAATTA